ncbi:acyltransferase [Massilia sp. ST3]|uniref:acyltransferase family protein n=1 Tax=Massilia sp. ST3 TaxID=2824903 RepID=UPI001B813AE5|nr:acyltransferase [Massilia sp. ST3]MBQ5947636.1 acyltransferase [Massilia sp. ST3]
MLRSSSSRTLGDTLGTHDNGFNLVRLVCALLVVVYHAWQLNHVQPNARDPLTELMRPVTDLGSLAVGVFFLVSGMFVGQSWLRDPHLGRFALRRVARIVPGLFVCLLVTTVLAVGLFSAAGWAGLADGAPWRFIFGGTVLHGLVLHIPPEELKIAGVLGGQFLNGPLWTLYWEGRMYVMVALIGAAAILPMRQWLGGAALFLLLAANVFPSVMAGYVWEVRLWSLFLTGVALQALLPQARFGAAQAACAAILMAISWNGTAMLNPSGLTWFGAALLAVTLALWAGSARPRRLGHFQRHDYSYGIYIYHWPVLLMLGEWMSDAGPVALCLAGMAVVLPLAALSWHLVEAPALRALRRRLRPPVRPVAAPVAHAAN